MTKPIPDKAEVALEYPDKLYIGTFERSAQFEAHLDRAGISLTLQRTGDAEARRSIRMHSALWFVRGNSPGAGEDSLGVPADDVDHRNALREAAKALHGALAAKPARQSRTIEASGPSRKGETDLTKMSPEEEVLLLHVLE